MTSLILSESPRPVEKEVTQGLEADFSQAHEAIMKEFIEAVGAGEPGKASRALKHFIKMCEKEEEYSEEGE